MILNLTDAIVVECKLTIFADWQLPHGLVVQGTTQLWISRTNRNGIENSWLDNTFGLFMGLKHCFQSNDRFAMVLSF